MRGDFGTTITGQPISDELGRRVGVSLRLLVIGSVLGTDDRCGRRRLGGDPAVPASDRVITVLSLLLLSTPVFVIANLLILGCDCG